MLDRWRCRGVRDGVPGDRLLEDRLRVLCPGPPSRPYIP